MPMFKGKRKHRSLSQRKHTIGKMVAKNQEAENPWTEEENRKLCNLGDAGKTLGDIHRKFRSRNAESCLNQYFHLKGYHTTGISRTHTSHQARQEPSQYPQSTQNTHYSSVIGRHRGYRLHSAASVVDPIPHRRIIGTVLEQSYQYPSRSNQNTPSVLPLRRELPSVARRDADMAGQDAVKDRQEATMARRNSAEAHTYPTPLNSAASTSSHQNLRAAASTPSHPVAEGPEYPTSAMSAQVMPPNALGALNGNAFDNPPSSEVVDNESTGSPFTSRHQRRALSSSPSASTVNSPTDSTPATSAATSPTTPSHPPGTHYSPESQKAAANRVGKSRRPAHLEGF